MKPNVVVWNIPFLVSVQYSKRFRFWNISDFWIRDV
jgi:hypothetical protein